MNERPHVFVRGDRAFPYKAEGATLYHHGELYAETARQRDNLLELVKSARSVLQRAPDDPLGPHPLLVKIDAAIDACKERG